MEAAEVLAIFLLSYSCHMLNAQDVVHHYCTLDPMFIFTNTSYLICEDGAYLPCNETTLQCSEFQTEMGHTVTCFVKLSTNEFRCAINCSTKRCLLDNSTIVIDNSTILVDNSTMQVDNTTEITSMPTTTEELVACQKNVSYNSNKDKWETKVDCEELKIAFVCKASRVCVQESEERDVCHDELESSGNTCDFDCATDKFSCKYKKVDPVMTTAGLTTTTEIPIVCDVLLNETAFTINCTEGTSFTCEDSFWPCPESESTSVCNDNNHNDMGCYMNCAAANKITCTLGRRREESTSTRGIVTTQSDPQRCEARNLTEAEILCTSIEGTVSKYTCNKTICDSDILNEDTCYAVENSSISCVFECSQSRDSCRLQYEGKLVTISPITTSSTEPLKLERESCKGKTISNHNGTDQNITTFKCTEKDISFVWNDICESDGQAILVDENNSDFSCHFNCSSNSVPTECELFYKALPAEKTAHSESIGMTVMWIVLIALASVVIIFFLGYIGYRLYEMRSKKRSRSYNVSFHNGIETVQMSTLR